MFELERYRTPDCSFAPIQILHDFQFVPLNVNEDYSVLKTLDDDAKVAHMEGRLRNLAECGYGGVVLNVDFENYLQNSRSFQVLDRVIDIAKDLNLRVWLYDEQYYPSGSAGGLVLKNHSELEGQGLACISKDVMGTGVAVRMPSPTGYSQLKYAYAVPIENGVPDFSNKVDISNCQDIAGGLCWDCESGEWRVYCFFVRALYELTYLAASYRASRRYPSIADKRAIQRFLDVTYEKYEKYLKTPIGDRVEAVFTDEPSLMCYREYPEERKNANPTRYPSLSIYDEPNHDIPFYPYIPWVDGIEADFEKQYDYRLQDALPEIFDAGENTEKYRIDFYSLLGKQVDEAYIGLTRYYTASQGMKLCGHYYGEEEFDRQPFMYGDILRQLGGMDIPGCDLLFSDMEKLRHSIACRLASSAAHIYSRPNSMIEASNMEDVDQSRSLRKFMAALSVMYIHGIDTIASYYAEQLFPFEEKKQFVEYAARLGAMLNGGKNRINTLLYYPYKQLCANCLPAGSKEENPSLDSFEIAKTAKLLMQKQICFDIINDDKISDCKVESGVLLTGYGEQIKRIVFPNIDFLDSDMAAFVQKASDSGVQIVFYGKKRKIRGISFEPLFVENLDDSVRILIDSEPVLKHNCLDVLMSHRVFDSYELYMFMNTRDEKVDFEVKIPEKLTTLSGVNPVTMELSELKISHMENDTFIQTELNGLECMMLYVKK